MAGDKQLVTLGFILVPAGVVRPVGVCSGHYIMMHRGACRGGLQARQERRPVLQVPEVLIGGRCQYRGEGGKRASERYPSSPCG
jgi:hypothetical protein